MSSFRVLRAGVLLSLAPMLFPQSLRAQQASPTPAESGRVAMRSAVLRVADARALLNAPDVVRLQVGSATRFADAHVPGARPVALSDVSTPRREGELTLELPDTPTLERWARSVGISNDTRHIVVIPDDSVLQSATRVIFTLHVMGLGDKVSLLDGGLDAWRAAGNAVERGEASALAPSSAPLTVRRDSSIIAVLSEVEAVTKSTGTTLIDARLPQFYQGNGGGYPRPGHIPSAVNVPLSLVSEGGRLRTPDELRALFAQAGVKPGQPAITYCHIGQQATLLWFVARELGYEVKMFDGSFQQWSGTSLPLGTP
jgi:thiosulfate/3-mercaptopyruvate sulfurtransferase